MFEYSIIGASAFMSIEQLNEFGNKGWELISIVPNDGNQQKNEVAYYYHFKRSWINKEGTYEN